VIVLRRWGDHEVCDHLAGGHVYPLVGGPFCRVGGLGGLGHPEVGLFGLGHPEAGLDGLGHRAVFCGHCLDDSHLEEDPFCLLGVGLDGGLQGVLGGSLPPGVVHFWGVLLGGRRSVCGDHLGVSLCRQAAALFVGHQARVGDCGGGLLADEAVHLVRDGMLGCGDLDVSPPSPPPPCSGSSGSMHLSGA